VRLFGRLRAIEEKANDAITRVPDHDPLPDDNSTDSMGSAAAANTGKPMRLLLYMRAQHPAPTTIIKRKGLEISIDLWRFLRRIR
jgi:hypothetical protein